MVISPIAADKSRVTLDLKSIGLPEIPRIGFHQVTQAAEPLTPHRHRGVMEICYLVRGEQTWNAAGRDYRLRGGEVFWTRPDEVHRSGSACHGKGLLYWMQVRCVGIRSRFLGLAPKPAQRIVRALGALPKRHFVGDERLKSLLEESHALARDSKDPLRTIRTACCVLQWLVLVIECARSNPAGGPTPDIAHVVAAIEAGRVDEKSVDELADIAQLSAAHFKAKFRRQIGIPPGEYLNRNRIERAAVLLAESDLSVTQVAHRLGFSSSQYFATTFKRFTHASPSEVIRRRTSSASC